MEETKWRQWTVDLQWVNNTDQEHIDVATDSPQMMSTSPTPQTHGLSPSCAPNTKPAIALTSSMTMQLASTIDSKRFLKVNSIKLKEPEDYFNWHMSLYVHAHMCGIYLPTLEEVEMYNIMGTGCLTSEMEPKHPQRNLMSNLLWQLLNNDDMFTSKEVSSLKTQVMVAKVCGYTTFYSIFQVCGHFRVQEVE